MGVKLNRKAVDLLAGSAVMALAYALIAAAIEVTGNEVMVLSAYTLLAAVLFVAARRLGRRYAAFGIMAMLVVPYLVLGACGIGTYTPGRESYKPGLSVNPYTTEVPDTPARAHRGWY